MPHVKPTLKQIYARVSSDMETRINNRISQGALGIFQVKILKVSLLGVLCAVIAGASYMLYGFLEYLAKQILPDTAEDDWLLRWARLYNYTQKAAQKASGTARFTGTVGTVVAAGTIIQNTYGILFETLQAGTITLNGFGYADIPVSATVAGISGNVTTTSMSLQSPLEHIDTEVTFTVLPTGGANQETVEELRARFLLKLRKPVTGGRLSDYVTWALSISGISRAWPKEAYNGAGTVGVIVAGPNNDAVPSQTLIECLDYIKTQKPLGVSVYVISIVKKACILTINVSSGTNDSTKDTILSNVSSVFTDEAEPGGTLLLSHLHGAITTSGVSNYKIVGISVAGVSQPIDDIATTGFDLLSLSTITFGTL